MVGVRIGMMVSVIMTLVTVMVVGVLSGPDAFVGPHSWLADLTRAGVAEPLELRSDIVAGATAAVSLRGFAYAAPIALDTIVQFRNSELLGSPPESIESLSTSCPAGCLASIPVVLSDTVAATIG